MRVALRTAIVLCLSTVDCGGSGGGGVTGPPPVASISVSLNKTSIVVGESANGTATVRDANGGLLIGRVIAWTSNNPAVATVNLNTGLIVAAGAGSATITASSEGRSGTANITVTLAPVASVTVQMLNNIMAVGSTSSAFAALRDASGNILTGREVSWSSDNSSVATVSNTGLVSALAIGSVNITATSEGHSGSLGLTVVTTLVASVTVSLASPVIAVGSGTQATARARDLNGVELNRTFTWSSDNISVATVTTTGVVTAVGLGSAHIVGTTEGINGSATITVAPSAGYASSGKKIFIVDIGTTVAPTVSGPSAGATTFASRATSIATVDAAGTITGVGAGQAWVAAAATGFAPDSVYVIVPRTSTGPILRTDLTTFNVKAGATTTVNIILDTRSTPIGGAEMSVGYTVVPPVFSSVGYDRTGPAVVNIFQPGVFRVSLASGNPITGELAVLVLHLTTPANNTSGFLTLTFLDLVSPTGADLLPTSTSTRIPIIVNQ